MRKYIYLLALLLVGVAIFSASYRESERQQQVGYEMASAESQPVICADAVMRDKIRSMMFEALDDALKDHIKHMFEVWMKDDRGQPERARNGIVNGVAAYIRATKGAAAWTPMECPG